MTAEERHQILVMSLAHPFVTELLTERSVLLVDAFQKPQMLDDVKQSLTNFAQSCARLILCEIRTPPDTSAPEWETEFENVTVDILHSQNVESLVTQCVRHLAFLGSGGTVVRDSLSYIALDVGNTTRLLAHGIQPEMIDGF
jgi:hypothetical protein